MQHHVKPLLQLKPDVIVVSVGANNATCDYTDEMVEKMRALLTTIIANDTIPVVSLMTPRTDRHSEKMKKYIYKIMK